VSGFRLEFVSDDDKRPTTATGKSRSIGSKPALHAGVPAFRHDPTDLAAFPIEISSAPCHLNRDDMVPNYTRQKRYFHGAPPAHREFAETLGKDAVWLYYFEGVIRGAAGWLFSLSARLSAYQHC
jgi:hypothetical protein